MAERKVRVATHALERITGQLKTIDWNNSSDRKWLVNHMHWAMHNNMVIELTPVDSN